MRAIVSFSDGSGDYAKKMLRLAKSAPDGQDFIGFTHYGAINCEPHSQIPYKFKPMSIHTAHEKGYDEILWCDSPIVVTGSLGHVWEYINKTGYMFFNNIGHSLGRWTNDKCLSYFGITREDAMNIPMIMACCMGFDFSHQITRDVFKEYKRLSDQLYPGYWDNHRHDQSVMSCLIHQEGLDILTGHETFFAYEDHYKVLPVKDSVCLISKGL